MFPPASAVASPIIFERLSQMFIVLKKGIGLGPSSKTYMVFTCTTYVINSFYLELVIGYSDFFLLITNRFRQHISSWMKKPTKFINRTIKRILFVPEVLFWVTLAYPSFCVSLVKKTRRLIAKKLKEIERFSIKGTL